MKTRIFIALAAAGLAFLLQTACSSSKAHELAATNSKNLKRMNEKLADLRTALVDARDALIEVQQQDGKKSKPFEDFTRKTAKLIPQIEWFNEQAEQLASNHAALIKEWDKSLEQIEIPELRAVAEAQKTKTFKTYQALPNLAATLSTTLSGLKKEYTDLQKLYSLTLSEETLSATTTMVALTATRSTELLSLIDNFMEQASIAIGDLDSAAGQGEQKGQVLSTQKNDDSEKTEQPANDPQTPSGDEPLMETPPAAEEQNGEHPQTPPGNETPAENTELPEQNALAEARGQTEETQDITPSDLAPAPDAANPDSLSSSESSQEPTNL